jgi:hypothetical protein
MRIGAAIHTPTWYSGMNDKWWSSMESSFDNGDSYSRISPEGEYEYKINTPFRAIGSLGFVFNEKGFVSLDYEYADYSTGKLKSSSDDFSDVNATIQSSYGKAHNVRLGTEWRHQAFSFRAGYSYAGSPYKNNINTGETTRYSAGMGFRKMPFFIDLAFVHERSRSDYYLYLEPTVQSNPSDNLYLSNHFILSAGFRF